MAPTMAQGFGIRSVLLSMAIDHRSQMHDILCIVMRPTSFAILASRLGCTRRGSTLPPSWNSA